MAVKKYGRPKKRNVDQIAVREFLQTINFDVQTVLQEWRHLLAFGTYQGHDAVFKLASTQQTGVMTQNEYRWNNAVHLVPQSQRPHLTVPRNYTSGFYGKLFYFIAERFMSQPLAHRDNPDMSRVIPRIGKIAQATHELEKMPIPATTKRKRSQSAGEKLLAAATEWASYVPRNLDVYLRVIENAKDSLRTCVGHGDFVIRQMYDVDGRIGIIDGEHAGFNGPLYLDPAQFFLRLCVDHQAKDVGSEYLRRFYTLLPVPDQEIFWEEIKPVLLQRFIGDLWWVAKRPTKLDTLMVLGEEILTDAIL